MLMCSGEKVSCIKYLKIGNFKYKYMRWNGFLEFKIWVGYCGMVGVWVVVDGGLEL